MRQQLHLNFCDNGSRDHTGTVHALAPSDPAAITAAADAYLATPAGPESAGTRSVYSGVLGALAEGLGPDTDVAGLQPRAVATWFTSR
jgi:hypothetical protein